MKNISAEKMEGWRWNQQRFTLFTFLLVSAMMACMIATLVKVVELFFIGWDGAYLVALSFLIALESLYSRRVTEGLAFPERKWILYRATEWVVILIVLKAAYYVVYGLDFLREDLALWQVDFETYFFNSEYLLGIAIAILVWGISTYFSFELSFLEGDAHALQLEQESGIFEARSAIRTRLVNLILFVGAAMVVFTAGMHFDSLVKWFELPVLQVGVGNVLLYFLLGLILLSMMQFSLLRVGWILEKIPMRKEIASRWFVYGLGFILFVALLASLLPTRYSFGLLATLNYLVTLVSGLFSLLFTLLMALIFLLLGLFSFLFASGTEDIGPMEPPQPLEAPPPSAPSLPVPWLEVLQSLAFWVVFLGVIGFSIAYYLNQHQEIALRLRRFPLMGALVDFWGRLRTWFGGVNRRIEVGFEHWRAQRAQRRAQRQEQAWNFINPRRLPPRQRVMFYYLAMVRRGGEQGMARRPSQTPYEYGQSLAAFAARQGPAHIGELNDEGQRPRWEEPPGAQIVGADVVEEIAALTDEFIEARYSQHEITEQHAGRVRRYWEHIQRALRSWRHGAKAQEKEMR